jgi:AsmA protein
LGRGTYHEGALKGRLLLNSVAEGTELRLQGAFDELDVASFVRATGQGRWIQGPGLGQFLIEARGHTPAEMVRNAAGRGSLTIKDGELLGVGLGDAIRRVEKRPLAASLNWKGGRTPFEQANVQFSLAGGIAEISDSRLTAPGLVTSLHGTLSLVDQQLDLKADVSPSPVGPWPGPALIFDLTGRWQNVVVSPDARSLIERSGAAKPLFGPYHPAAATPQPLVTAQ